MQTTLIQLPTLAPAERQPADGGGNGGGPQL
jgi:hypothetical protein